LPFYVTTDFRDRPDPQISITVAGAEPEGLTFALSDVRSCQATDSEHAPDLHDVTLSPSILNSYFPLNAVPELRTMALHRFTLSRGDGYPIVCQLARASDKISYDSHVVRFVKPLDVPFGSKMVLSTSDTFRLDQSDIENVRFGDSFGTISVEMRSPLYMALSASPDKIPTPADLRQSLVATAEWTDKSDTHRHEFVLLLIAAALGGAFACFIEALRPVISDASGA
jgi:hypothetical protein